MKAKKKSSLFAYSLLSIASGVTLMLTILSVILPIIFSLTKTEMPGWFGLMVRLEPISKATPPVINHDYIITGIQGRLTILHHQTIAVMILNTLISIIIFGSLSCGIFLLRKIIKNVHEGEHFIDSNVTNTRIIALLLILVPYIVMLLKNIILSSLPYNLIVREMKVVNVLGGPVNSIVINLFHDYMLPGLILLVFAEVFKEGKRLKQENDLTV